MRPALDEASGRWSASDPPPAKRQRTTGRKRRAIWAPKAQTDPERRRRCPRRTAPSISLPSFPMETWRPTSTSCRAGAASHRSCGDGPTLPTDEQNPCADRPPPQQIFAEVSSPRSFRIRRLTVPPSAPEITGECLFSRRSRIQADLTRRGFARDSGNVTANRPGGEKRSSPATASVTLFVRHAYWKEHSAAPEYQRRVGLMHLAMPLGIGDRRLHALTARFAKS